MHTHRRGESVKKRRRSSLFLVGQHLDASQKCVLVSCQRTINKVPHEVAPTALQTFGEGERVDAGKEGAFVDLTYCKA
jgi:hypothetical protein